MMINSNNRTPSPMLVRNNPNHNPNSRNNQEREVIGARKSFSLSKSSSINGNPRSLIPNAPPNSPSEFVRRCSFGKEDGTSLQDHEKENEQELNSKPIARVRSPSVPKMTKNFMSPTISAASKINPSPRKKVLGERNDAIRTSASLSDGKFHFFSKESLDFSDENVPKEDMVTPQCSSFSHMNKSDELLSKVPEKKATDFNPGVEKIEFGTDFSDENVPKEDMLTPQCSTFSHMNKLDELLNKEPGIKAIDFTPGVENFELGADIVVLSPEMPVNDAKSEIMPKKFDMPNVVKNVGLNAKITTCSSLSTTIPLDAYPSLPPYDPKTNFLSPRPQFLHYKPKPRIESYIINEGVRLEDGFSSVSGSETEISEEVQSEITSSVETSLEEKFSLEESSSQEIQQLEESVEQKHEARPWFGGMWKAVCLISIVILLGFTAVYQGNISEENVDALLSTMGLKARDIKFSPLPYDNLTAWKEMETEDCFFKDFMLRLDKYELRHSHSGEEIELSLYDYEDDELIEEFESKELEENNVVEDYVIENEVFVVEKIEEASSFSEMENQEFESAGTSEVQDELQCNLQAEDQSLFSLLQTPEVQPQLISIKNQEVQSAGTSEVQDEFQSNLHVEDQSIFSLPQAFEVHHKVATENDVISEVQGEFQPEFNVKDHSLSSSPKEPKEPQLMTANDPVIEVSEGAILEAKAERISASKIAAASVVMSLLAATAFLFVKRSSNSIAITGDNTSTHLPAASKIEHKVHENQTNWSAPLEVDMMGESYPSEISSFQDKPYNLKASSHEEAQSVEKSSRRNYKRESLASSSSEYSMSASYGSYTTYSKLHSKQRDDGEVVTPVRRSSRIRSKVTSP